MKFPWWRGAGLRGKLTIHGRRRDAAAPPLLADIPNGYGDPGFQATALVFPTEGCWEVTGQVADTSLNRLGALQEWPCEWAAILGAVEIASAWFVRLKVERMRQRPGQLQETGGTLEIRVAFLGLTPSSRST